MIRGITIDLPKGNYKALITNNGKSYEVNKKEQTFVCS